MNHNTNEIQAAEISGEPVIIIGEGGAEAVRIPARILGLGKQGVSVLIGIGVLKRSGNPLSDVVTYLCFDMAKVFDLARESALFKTIWRALRRHCKKISDLAHAQSGLLEPAADAAVKVDVDHFFTDLLTALKNNAFGDTPSKVRRMFKLVEKKHGMEYILSAEKPDKRGTRILLYLRPKPIIDAIRVDKESIGKFWQVDRAELQVQMKTMEYWVPAPPTFQRIHRQRFEGGDNTETCWCINLDQDEMKYLLEPLATAMGLGHLLRNEAKTAL